VVTTEGELVAAIARDRAAGKTVAFANGCFDLLHVGHVRYLAGAAAEADRLIVAVNDDRSVAGLKGAGRPILPAPERADLVPRSAASTTWSSVTRTSNACSVGEA
jgi:cytidyltransferase-like protein